MGIPQGPGNTQHDFAKSKVAGAKYLIDTADDPTITALAALPSTIAVGIKHPKTGDESLIGKGWMKQDYGLQPGIHTDRDSIS